MIEKIYILENKIGQRKSVIVYSIITLFMCSFICFLGLYNGHDIDFHLSRLQAIVDGLDSGVFPVIIYPNYLDGYGYANGIFYPDLFLYIPAFIYVLLRKIGISIGMTYNLFLILINMFAIYSTYLCIKKITNNYYVALLFSRILVLSPYFLTDAYIRSALGEHISFAFFPLVILGLYELLFEDIKKGYYFTIGIVGIVYSHIISTVLCFILVLVIVLLNIKHLLNDRNRIVSLFVFGFIAIGISCYQLLPIVEAVIDNKYFFSISSNNISNISYRAVPIFKSIFEFNYSNDYWIPMGIGTIFVFLIGYAIIIKKEMKNKFANQLFIIGVFLLFMSTDVFPWNKIDLFNFIQFPWRLYQLVTLCFVISLSIKIKDLNLDRNKLLKLSTVSHVAMIFTLAVFLTYTMSIGINIGFSRKITYDIGNGEYIPAN